jgi:hypothetical protein
MVDRDVVAVKVARAVREQRRRRELPDDIVQHADELVVLQVFDAAAAAVHEEPQLATEDLGCGLRLGAARIEIRGNRADRHDDARAAAAQRRKCAPDAELEVVRVRAERDHRAPGIAGGEAARRGLKEGEFHSLRPPRAACRRAPSESRGFAGRS